LTKFCFKYKFWKWMKIYWIIGNTMERIIFDKTHSGYFQIPNAQFLTLAQIPAQGNAVVMGFNRWCGRYLNRNQITDNSMSVCSKLQL
jgi:hypothetical protein